MTHTETVKTKKPLTLQGGETLPAGTEITLTEEWETIPYGVQGRIILDPQGQRRLVVNDELEYALGAH
jgi:hypothetical protein